MIFSGSLLGTLLGLAASLLVLSLLVQVVQELWKYLSDSKGRTYTDALIDLLGPWATQLRRSDVNPNLFARGPFQFRQIRPRDVLLPMDQPTLVAALERTAPLWVQRTLNQLQLEVELQKKLPAPPSPVWNAFISELRELVHPKPASKRNGNGPNGPRPPGYKSAQDVLKFLESWGGSGHPAKKRKRSEPASASPGAILDAHALYTAFRRVFLPHVLDAERDFAQLERNFEHSYRRKNLRHSFTIALLLAVIFNLPFQVLWMGASRLSEADAAAAAEKALATYERSVAARNDPASDSQDHEFFRQLDEIVTGLPQVSGIPAVGGLTDLERRSFWEGWSNRSWGDRWSYFLGCLVSALLVSFGAPFWNDLAGALLRARPKAGPNPET